MSRRLGASVTAAVVAASVLAACSSGSGGANTLTWYIIPDSGGQSQVAASCTESAGGRYRIEVAPLPNDATQQREQLVRRLAANDDSIDLMSIDPPFTAEFANAGFLRPFTEEEADELTDGVLTGPVESAKWDNELVAVPYRANTQLLWYRKSVAAKAGLDPSREPVTWDQIIDAAVATNTTVEVQAKKYEGYTVLINALVSSAGGQILENPEAGKDAQPGIDTEAGKTAARIINKLARSGAADPSISTSAEETARLGFQAANGGFMVNWPYVYGNAKKEVAEGSFTQAAFDDIAYARYPQAVEGEESTPPVGGLHVAVGAFGKNQDLAVEAIRCITSVESETADMLSSGEPAAREAVYDDPEIRETLPMADLVRESIDQSAPRPITPYYTDVTQALQNTFHPPSSVNPDSTPRRAAEFIPEVLHDKVLL